MTTPDIDVTPAAPTGIAIWQPNPKHPVMKVLRIGNFLEADTNMLSPTRISVWFTTFQSFIMLAVDFIHAAPTLGQGIATGGSMIASGFAHWIHASDKKERNAQAIRLQNGGDH